MDIIKEEILNSFKSKNILVTGGTGMIGKQIIDILKLTDGHIKSLSLDNIKIPDIECIKGDLTDFNFCKEVTKDIDYVFHIAGIKGSIEVTKTKPASFFVPLLQMNTNVLEACRLNKVQKIVYTSSIGAYSNAEIFKESTTLETDPPMDMYPGWAKRIAEMQIQAYNIQYSLTNFAIVRLCNIYGPGDSFDPNSAMVIPSLIYRIYYKNILKTDPIIVWGDGSAVRDFVYCKDAAEGIILALYYGTESKYYNLGSGFGYTIKQLVETLAEVISFNYKFDTSKPSGYSKRVMDISLAKEKLGYNPSITLKDGLQETWNWFKNHSKEFELKNNYFVEG